MTIDETHEVNFIPSGRGKARCAPDPDYPKGIEVKLNPAALKRLGAPAKPCVVKLPYPAPECGTFEVSCKACGLTVMITAAGRADDPVSVELPCLPIAEGSV